MNSFKNLRRKKKASLLFKEKEEASSSLKKTEESFSCLNRGKGFAALCIRHKKLEKKEGGFPSSEFLNTNGKPGFGDKKGGL